MEDKQCKQTERLPVMAKASDYFLSLDINPNKDIK